jgi:hypothetical protein
MSTSEPSGQQPLHPNEPYSATERFEEVGSEIGLVGALTLRAVEVGTLVLTAFSPPSAGATSLGDRKLCANDIRPPTSRRSSSQPGVFSPPVHLGGQRGLAYVLHSQRGESGATPAQHWSPRPRAWPSGSRRAA